MKELIEKMREAGNKQFECTCNEAYKSRQMADPDCAYCDMFDELIEQCATVAASHYENKWVRVADKLPENRLIVYVYTKQNRYSVATFYETDQWERKNMFVLSDGGYLSTDFITHWQKPTPPNSNVGEAPQPPVVEDAEPMSEPLTEDILYEMGFTQFWPEYLENPEYRRGAEHPEGKAYVATGVRGAFRGILLTGYNKPLHTKQDLIDYLNDPNRHKG